MNSWIGKAAGWVQRRAENVIAALLGVMFIAFMLQIVFRYFLNLPTGWSTETTLICWMWLVLGGTALALREKDEIRLDILTSHVGPRARRVMAGIVAIAAIGLFGWSLRGSYQYVAFMKVERSSYLNIRLDVLYSIYVIFVVTIILRYAWSLWKVLRGEPLGDADGDAPADEEATR